MGPERLLQRAVIVAVIGLCSEAGEYSSYPYLTIAKSILVLSSHLFLSSTYFS
jgi:hypothetical protein